jgi:hypothetical protein
MLLVTAPYNIQEWRGNRERGETGRGVVWDAETRNIEVETNVYCQPTIG